MRTKTASAIDFLSLPQKTSSALYEVLASEAASAYEKNGVPPDQTIAKQASERGFNSDQIHRVAELTNHQINATLVKSAEDQLFTFPVASVAGVEECMKTPKRGVKKVASTEEDFDDAGQEKIADIDFGAYHMLDKIPDYVDLIASRRFEQKLAGMEKAAEDEPKYVAPDPIRNRALEGIQKKADADLEYSEIVLRESLSNLSQAWQKTAESPEDSAEFLYAGAAVVGIEAVQQLAQVFGESAQKLAEALDPSHLEVILPHVDTQHPVVLGFEDFRGKIEEYGKAKEASERVHAATAKAQESARKLSSKAKSTFVAKTLNKPAVKLVGASALAAKVAPSMGMRRGPAALTAAKMVTGYDVKKARFDTMKRSVKELQ